MAARPSVYTVLLVPVDGIQDDDDTKTAIGIDNDTTTARFFAPDALPSDSMVSTCRNIYSDTRTARNIISDVDTARDIKEKGWFESLFDFLFPIGSAEDANGGGIHRKYNSTEFHPCGAAIFGRK